MSLTELSYCYRPGPATRPVRDDDDVDQNQISRANGGVDGSESADQDVSAHSSQ